MHAAAIANQANHLSHKMGFPYWRIVGLQRVSPGGQEIAANAGDPMSYQLSFSSI